MRRARGVCYKREWPGVRRWLESRPNGRRLELVDDQVPAVISRDSQGQGALMNRLGFAFVMLTATAFGGQACSDDQGRSGDAAGGTAGTAGVSGEAGAATLANLACDPEAATTCQNEQDCPFVVNGSARMTAQSCGQGECLSSTDDDTCARDCMLAVLDMSSECATCYAGLLNCTIKHCLGACLANAASEGCQSCLATSGCRPTFDSCTGLPE